MPRTRLAAAVETVEELAPPTEDDDAAWRAELVSRWSTVRPFLPLLAEVIPFGATSAGQPVLHAVRELPELIGRKKVRVGEIRDQVLTGSWRKLVTSGEGIEAGCVDKHAYALSVLEALHRALRHRDVFATGSQRWGDPRARLLDGAAWEAIRPSVLTGLKLTEEVGAHLDEQATALDAAWRHLGTRLSATAGEGWVRVEPGRDGRAQVRVDALEKLAESPSLVALRELTERMRPRWICRICCWKSTLALGSCPSSPTPPAASPAWPTRSCRWRRYSSPRPLTPVTSPSRGRGRQR